MVMEGQNTEKRVLEERGNFPLYYTVKVERRGGRHGVTWNEWAG